MKQFDLEAFLELLRDIVKTLIVSYCGGLKICINFDREDQLSWIVFCEYLMLVSVITITDVRLLRTELTRSHHEIFRSD